MKKVHVVAHTHWDREWYFTLEDSNLMLVEHMNFLIDFLEGNKNFPYFTFDGQASVVEEYLRLCPQNEVRLRNLISSGRIIVGPWYTQCDTLTIKIESLIRNLEYGKRVIERFGNVMPIGYLPDVFGQNGYLPSVFKNSGITHSILQRGYSIDDANKSINFKWVGLDNVHIDTNNIYYGYGPGKFLSIESDYLNRNLLPILNDLEKKSNGEEILLPSGGDQALIRTHFIKTIKDLNSVQDSYEFIFSNYEKFINSVKEFNYEVKGELIACEKSRIHRTIHSQRVDIKILNTEVEKLLIERLEPLCVLAHANDVLFNQAEIDVMWKLMFDVHAHDSIGGCNSDETNFNIKQRLTSVKNMAEGFINILCKKLALQTNSLYIFNFDNIIRGVEATVFTRDQNFILKNENNNVDYNIVNQEYISGGTKVEVTTEGEKIIEVAGYYKTNIMLNSSVKNIEILQIVEGITNDEIAYQIEEVVVIKDHVLLLKKNNELCEMAFEIISDMGDSYDFSPGSEAIVISKFETYTVRQNNITTTYNVTYDILGMKLDTVVVVNNKTGYISVAHKFVNILKNKRIRVMYSTANHFESNYADSGFGIINRSNIDAKLDVWKEEKHAEMPQAIYPFERFVTAVGKTNITILNSATKEYEVSENKLLLTLMRSVDVLGRDDLATRPGRASGINNKVVYTPDAQMINTEINCTYNIAINIKGEYKLYDQISKYKYMTYQNQNLNSFLNRLDRFELPVNEIDVIKEILSINSKLHLSAMYVKNDNLYIRLFNSSSDIITEFVTSSLYTFEVSDFNGKQVDTLSLSKGEYITLKGVKNGN